MFIVKLVLKNSLRHKLRTFLTILGIAITVISFCVLRTVITAWDEGVNASAMDRLITRHSVSYIFQLPYAYKEKMAQIPGIQNITFSNWFGGIYKDKDQFFSRIAVDENTFFDVYPEYILSKQQLEDFKNTRNSCVVGAAIAKQYGFKIGDIIPIEGDIYPGRWEFVVKGIYQPRDKSTDATQLFFQYTYLDEAIKKVYPARAGEVGWYIVKIKDQSQASTISQKIDNLFSNSMAETKTETERAFVQGFMASMNSIITSMNLISFIIIGIILLVMGNTMIMAARERTREYAVLKTLGFTGKHILGLILGESLTISIIGGVMGLFMSFPIIKGIEENIPKGIFPIFNLVPGTVILAISSVVFIGILASVFPLSKALKTKIVDGFRFVG